MSTPGRAPSSSDGVDTPKRRGLIQPEIIDLVVPPLKVGGWCGAAGAMTGIGAAIVQDASPAISGIMTGTQWAALGTSYWFSRSVLLRAWGDEKNLTPFNKVTASAIAGLPPGALMGLTTKTRSIPSSMIFCSVVTGGGQILVNYFSGRQGNNEENSWFRSSWSPLKKLDDKEYIDMMEEKILRVDADIALIDERIANLRTDQSQGKSG